VAGQHRRAMAFPPEQAFQLVKSAHERGRLAHAFLISGPRGCGKERLAAQIVKMLDARGGGGGGGFDLFGEAVVEEIPPLDELAGEWVRIVRPQSKSRRIVVDAIRELEKSLYVSSGPKTWKVGVICDADRMAPAAENAFLKTLEEPPPRTLLLLLTANTGGLLPTVLSRCVRMPLTGEPDLTEGAGADLLAALDHVARAGFGSASVALTLKSVFSSILESSKAEAVEAAEALLKEEEKALNKGFEGDWLKRREEALKAAAESEYIEQRVRLFDVLQSWMADILRCKTGAGGLDFPGSKEAVASLAGAEDLGRLMRRMEAVGEMRSNLDTNAQEQLALEVGFLKAFA
jgi:DNA polymerase III subunit delta'